MPTNFVAETNAKAAEPTAEILIVESYGSNTRSISAQLSALPFRIRVLSAVDAEAALALLHSQSADLAIVDGCLCGNVDGFELCRALRSFPSTQQLPIILLLSGSLSLERSKGMLAGADLLLHRPVVKEELNRMVELLLAEKLAQAAALQKSANIQAGPKLRSVR